MGTPWARRVTRLEVSRVAPYSARLKGLASEVHGCPCFRMPCWTPPSFLLVTPTLCLSQNSALGHEEEASRGSEGGSTGVLELQFSHMHQRLLSDLLSSIETEVQAWRRRVLRCWMKPDESLCCRLFSLGVVHI